MPSYWIYTIGTIVIFLVLLRDSWKNSPFLAFALVLIVLYDYVTEFVGLRMPPFPASYYYGDVPLRLCFLAGSGVNEGCTAANRCIPLPVLLMEASILMAVMRTTDLLAPRGVVKPFLDALIAVNLDVMLDPIVSASLWCGGGAGPSFGGLGLWTWLTRPDTPGHWFGVPLFNYIAWFADNFAFVAMLRVIHHFFNIGAKGKPMAFAAAVGAVGLVLALEGGIVFVLKDMLDLSVAPRWQWGIIGTMVLVSAAVVLPSLLRLRHDHPLQVPLLLPTLFYFGFGLGALLLSPSLDGQPVLYLVWAACLLFGAAHAFSPYWRTLRADRTPG